MTALLVLAGLVAFLTGAVASLATGVFDSPVVLDTVSWGLILGVLTPLLTSIVQQPRWSARRRSLVGAFISIVVGVLTCLSNGDIDNGQTLLSTVAVVLVAAQATYKGLWKPSGAAPAIESATSSGQPAANGDESHPQ